MGVFDTHAHYDSGAFNQDRLEVLAGLPEQGVELIVNPGCDLPSSRKALELAHTFPFVYAAVGIHPSDCGDFKESQMGELEELARDEKVKAIGEIGLDYYWKDNPPRALQQNVFHRQLELAQSLRLPVIVHDREAHQDCLSIVREHPQVTGVYHCYSGSLEDAKVLVKLGWMLSFTGVITYKNARKALEVIDWLPMDRIMIETDSPYLTPEPFRGKRNDSGLIAHTAAVLARELDVPEEDVVLALEAIQDPVSLFEPIYNDGGDAIYIIDQVKDPRHTDSQWLENLAVSEALRRLTEREQRILRMRFFEGRTQMEVAGEIGISQAQVSRLEKNALQHMRKYVSEN